MWLRLALLLLPTLATAAAQDAAPPQTFTAAEGASPWYDRSDWTLSGVPDSVKGPAPVPQQSCTSRSIVLSGQPAAIVIGIYEKDLATFEALGLQAAKTGETFSVKNPSGITLAYVVYRVTAPPAKIGGGFTAGPVLLKIEGGTGSPATAASAPSPAAPAPPPPAVPAPAPAPASADKTFLVGEGALPWYDRSDWILSGVPDSLASSVPVPQQACSSHAIVLVDPPKSVVIGVYEKDLPTFDALGLQAAKTGETFSVKNPAGITLAYIVYRVTAPPAKIGGAFIAGLVLLKIEATAPASTPAPASAPVAAADPVPARPPFDLGEPGKLHLYLLIGQSNMVGRDATGIENQTPDPRIGSFDATGHWVIAIEPIYTGGNGFGPGTFFAASLLANRPQGKIGLIPCAVGGTALSHWVKGGDLYEAALKRAKLAAGAGILDGVLWHQGESDALEADLANTYEARLVKMFLDLRADLGRPDLPIVVGQLGTFVQEPYVDTVRAAIKDAARIVPRVGYADSEGLADKGDHLHFSVASQKEMGARYAAAMQSLLAAPTPPHAP